MSESQTPNNRMILMALVLGTFMTALDATIVSVAIPTMAAELGEAGHDTQNISWVLLIYTLMLGCFVLMWSKVGSMRGYKKVFMSGVGVFAAASFFIGMCGLFPAVGLGAIILLRAVQGLGAGMVMAMSLAMVSTYLPKEVRGASIGAVTLATSAGTAFGPAIGGILTTFHWSYIFFINVPIGILCLLMCTRYLTAPEHTESAGKRLDVVGAALLFVMLFMLILYLNQGQDIGWISEQGLVMIVVAMIAAGGVLWWEGRTEDPLISLEMIRNTMIRRCCLVTMLLFMAMAGSYLLLPYYLGYVKGYETMQFGFILIANSAGMMAAGPLVGRIADRTGQNRIFVVAGSLICALGFFMMTRFAADTGLVWIVASLFVMGVGIGMAMVASTNLSFGYISEGENGQLSGLVNTFRQAGNSSGVAILNAVFMSAIVLTPTVELIPGFRHAFFVAVVLVMMAFAVAMGLRDRPQAAEA